MGPEHTGPFTRHLLHIGKWTLVLLGVVLLLSGLRPPGLGPAGVSGIEITKPPWYFLWLYPFENWLGVAALCAVPAVLTVELGDEQLLELGRIGFRGSHCPSLLTGVPPTLRPRGVAVTRRGAPGR